MPKFVVQTENVNYKPMIVSLEQDGDDVNIILDGEIVAWFSGDDGLLWRTPDRACNSDKA